MTRLANCAVLCGSLTVLYLTAEREEWNKRTIRFRSVNDFGVVRAGI